MLLHDSNYVSYISQSFLFRHRQLQCHFCARVSPRAFLDLVMDLRVKCSLNHRRSIPRLHFRSVSIRTTSALGLLTSSIETSRILLVRRSSRNTYTSQYFKVCLTPGSVLQCVHPGRNLRVRIQHNAIETSKVHAKIPLCTYQKLCTSSRTTT